MLGKLMHSWQVYVYVCAFFPAIVTQLVSVYSVQL